MDYKLYYVSGIVSLISDNIPPEILPTFVETRLIPLDDCIIYDVFIYTHPVSIGANLRKIINQKIKKATTIRDIYDSLI